MMKRISLICLLCVFWAAVAFGAANARVEIRLREDSGDYARAGSVASPSEDGETAYEIRTSYGFLALSEDGAYRYRPDAESAAVLAARDAGGTLADAFTLAYTDGEDRRRDMEITVEIAFGDAPASDATHRIAGLDQIAEGRLADADDVALYTAFETECGEAAVASDGAYTYLLHNERRAVQALAAGETREEIVVVRATLPDGETRDTELAFIIEGVDDAPSLFSFTYERAEDGDIRDISGNALWGSTLGDGDEQTHAFGWLSDAQYGEAKLSPNGGYAYGFDNENPIIQALSEGDTLVETLKYAYIDKNGSVAVGVVKITIHGADDAPTVKRFTHDLTEDGGEYEIKGDALALSTLGDGTREQHTFTWSGDAKYGAATLGADAKYTYVLDNDNENVQALSEGETLTEVFTYRYTDKDGSFADGSVTITIHGADDTPTVKRFTHDLTEDGGEYEVTGDALEGAALGDGTREQHTFEWSGNAMYGVATLGADAKYAYTLDNDSEVVQALSEGDTLTEVFTYRYTDKDGSCADGSVTITIHGADDAPTVKRFAHDLTEDGGEYEVTGDALEGAALGDGTREQHTFTWSGAAKYGVATLGADAKYTYVLDNDNENVQALSEGDTLTEVFTYRYTDKDGSYADGSITITIHGADDAPTVRDGEYRVQASYAGALNGNALEGATLGDGSASSHRFLWTSTDARYGAATLNADGTFTYRLNLPNDALHALGEGETVRESFSFVYADADGSRVSGSVAVVIMGEDDAPTVKSFTHEMTEDGGKYEVAGDALAGSSLGDGDPGAHVFAWLSAETAVYGSVSLGANGDYRYTLDNAAVQFLMPNEKREEVYEFSYADADGSKAYGKVVVTIIGANDEPVVRDHTVALTVNTYDGMAPRTGNVLEGARVGDGRMTFAWGVPQPLPSFVTLDLKADGSYTIAVDHTSLLFKSLSDSGWTDLFVYTYTDEDGDVARGGLRVSLSKETPSALTLDVGSATADLDEKNLPKGSDPQPSALTRNVTLRVTPGASVAKIVLTDDASSVSAVAYENNGLTAANVIQYAWGSLTLRGFDAATGEIEFSCTLDQTIKNPASSGDFWIETVDVAVTGKAGDQVDGSVQIRIKDDVPAISLQPSVLFLRPGETKKGTYAGVFGADQPTQNSTFVSVGNMSGTFSTGTGGSYEYTAPTFSGNAIVTEEVSFSAKDGDGDTADETLHMIVVSETMTVNMTQSEWETATYDVCALPDGFSVQLVSDEYLSVVANLDGKLEVAQKKPYPFSAGCETGAKWTDTISIPYTAYGADGTIVLAYAIVNDGPTVRSVSRLLDEIDDSEENVDRVPVKGNVLEGSTYGAGTQSEHTFAWENPTAQGTFGHITLSANGDYAYYFYQYDDAKLESRKDEVFQLAHGDTLSEGFGYSYKDKDGALAKGVLTITITGVNNAPQAAEYKCSIDKDDASDTVTGDVFKAITLGDGGKNTHTIAWNSNVDPKYGAITRNADGTFTYTLDNGNASVRALGSGDALTETFPYSVSNRGGATASAVVTVTIHGADSGPTVQSFTHSLTEDSGDYKDTVTGNALAGSTLGMCTAAQHEFRWTSAASSAYGTVTLNADGTYEFVLDNAKQSVQALGASDAEGEVFSYEYEDLSENKATGSVTIRVYGANDKPSGPASLDVNLAHNIASQTYSIADKLELGDGDNTFEWTHTDTSNGSGITTNDADRSFTLKLTVTNPRLTGLGVNDRLLCASLTYTLTDADGDVATGNVYVYAENKGAAGD